MMPRSLLASVVTSLAVAGACTSPPRRTTAPEAPARQAALAHLDAVARQDATAIWDGLTDAARAETSLEAIDAHLKTAPAVTPLASRGQGDITYPGPRAGLVFREVDGRYSLVSALPRFDARHDPEVALATFARAFRLRDVELLLAFVPKAQRATITPSVFAARLTDPRFISETEAALLALTEGGRGERAGELWSISAPPHTARFILEDGGWVLLTLQ
jgi:hypothetical protein